MTFDRRALPVDRQVAFVVAARAWAARLATRAQALRASVVVLETCERFEVYADNALAREMHEAGREGGREGKCLALGGTDAPRRWLSGLAAARHLFRVASGIESRIVGEPHILGQVRRALERAIAQGTCAGELRRVVEGAVQCGRRVRREVSFAGARIGYAEQAAEVIASRGPSRAGAESALSGEAGQRRRVVIVGTGELARAAAAALRRNPSVDLAIAGRHADRVRALAEAVSAAVVSVDALAAGEIAADAVLSAIDPLRPVVSLPALQRAGVTLAIDLGALPAIESSEDVRGIELLRLSAFGASGAGDGAVARAEALAARELDRLNAVRRDWRKPSKRRLLPHLALAAT